MPTETTYPVQHRTINAAAIDQTPIVPGMITVAADSGQQWFDTLDGDRVILGKNIEYHDTEASRQAILIPEADVLYIVRATGKMYIYVDGQWKCLNATLTSYFDIFNVELKAATNTSISDSRVTSITTVNIVPDLTMVDLYKDTDYSVAVEDGKITITSTYTKPMYVTLQCSK